MDPAWLPVALKLLGSTLVIGAGGVAGFSCAGRLEAELDELERLEAALTALSSEISYSLMPLPGALSKAGERAGGTTGAIFQRIGGLSGLAQRRTPVEALVRALDDEHIGRFQEHVLKDLVRNLGTSGHKEQVRHIEMSIDRVRSWRRRLEDDYRKKARVYRYLGLFSGVGVAIVLL